MIRILKNFLSLTFINILSLIISLITVPHIINKVGITYYGEYAFYFLIAQFFAILIEYGFDIYAIKAIRTKGRDYKPLFYQILFIRLILFLLTLLIYILVSAIFNVNFLVGTLLLLSNIYMVFSCNWFFQYKENMFPISLINLFGRLLYLFLLFSFEKIDISTISFFYLLSSIFIAILSYLLIYNSNLGKFKLSYLYKNKEIFSVFKESTTIFTYRFFSSLFTPLTSVVIKYFFGFSAIAIFDIFNKFSGVINMVSYSFTQAIYPTMARNIKEIKNGKAFFLYFVFVFLFTTSLLVFSYFFKSFSDAIINYLFPSFSSELISIIPFIFIGSFFVSLNNFLSRVLVLLEYQNMVIQFTLLSLLLTLTIECFVLPNFSDLYVVTSVIIFQSLLTIFMLIKYIKSIFI